MNIQYEPIMINQLTNFARRQIKTTSINGAISLCKLRNMVSTSNINTKKCHKENLDSVNVTLKDLEEVEREFILEANKIEKIQRKLMMPHDSKAKREFERSLKILEDTVFKMRGQN